MICEFTFCTVYFPIIKDSYLKFHIDSTDLEEGRILQIDFTVCFGHVTCIHCLMVDLPNLKEEQGIPEPYSLFNTPCKHQLQVSFQERGLVLYIIYFDKLEGSQFNPISLKQFDQHSYTLQMYERYTLAIIRFPLVYTSDPKYDFTIFHPPGNTNNFKLISTSRSVL